MKYLLFSDIHHRGREYLDEIIKNEKPDRIIFAGDYDTVETFKKIKDISENILSIIIPGNHDFSVYIGEKITSQAYVDQKFDSKILHNILMQGEHDKEREFLEKILFSKPSTKKSPPFSKEFHIDPETHENHYKTLVIHDALKSSEEQQSIGNMLWKRLKEPAEYHFNFQAMRKNKYKVMIRGHDHPPGFATNHRLNGMTFYKPFQDDDPTQYKILRENQVIITIGALYNGFYSTIETSTDPNSNPILSFKSIHTQGV